MKDIVVVFGSSGHISEPLVWVAGAFKEQDDADLFVAAATQFGERVWAYLRRIEDPPMVDSPAALTEGGENYAPSPEDSAKWTEIRAKFGDVDPMLPAYGILDIDPFYFTKTVEIT